MAEPARAGALAGDAQSPRWLYDPSLSLREARALYFARAGFDESSYAERWVWVTILGRRVPATLNTPGRVRAVKLHDLHHVLTGYPTTWTGEAEIGAWELASGCRTHLAAWYLNAWAALIGLFIAPRRVLAAYRRGRRERNLYGGELTDALLAEKVGAARARLGIAAA
jgi:hypothetical protein